MGKEDGSRPFKPTAIHPTHQLHNMDSLPSPSPPALCKAVSYINCKVPMRDGVSLAADVYLPPDALGTHLPVLLSYSPYGATSNRAPGLIDAYIPKKIAVVTADCRGLHHSEGSFHPWQPSFVDDAYDLLDWIASQPWSNGRVAMVGGSYPGATQLACMRSGHPALAVCSPSAVTLDPYSIYYANGAQIVAFQGGWHIGISTHAPAPQGAPSFADAAKSGPVGEIPARMGIECESWSEQCRHEGRDAFWAAKGDLCDIAKSRAAVFYQGSWYDKLGVAVFETFDTFLHNVDDPSSPRRYSCLRVGPWGHGVNMHEGEIDFGKVSKVTEDPEVEFLLAGLEGRAPLTATNPAPIQIFVMGRNTWRFEKEWPLARTVYKPLYLSSDGAANTAAGDGRLSFDKSTIGAACDHFAYDPQNPVPSNGGRDVGKGGQRDQTEIERRGDVLVYTGEPLKSDLEVTGRVTASLTIASSAPDTDFTVKLVDVFPDGRPMSVLDGICRARYRDGLDKPPRLLVPNEPATLEFFVDVTSYCFLAGHRIRVEISSSNFPHFAPNPNTGRENATEHETRVAMQTVFHTADAPSFILLPTIPEEAK